MISVEIKNNDQTVGKIIADEKVFNSGARGFYGMDKVEIDGKRYRVQVQLVEIGSRPKTGQPVKKP